MRYRLPLLLLMAVLPLMPLLAAPIPAPSAVLDIGPPPKDSSSEKHRKKEIEKLNHSDGLFFIAYNIDAEFRKLPVVARLKDVRPWLTNNLQIKEEDGGRRLRLSFRSGNRADQVIIVNALLRANLKSNESRIKYFEDCINSHEERIVELERRIEAGQHRDRIDSYRKEINDLRSNDIPACHAEVDRLKQFTVIKWAK